MLYGVDLEKAFMWRSPTNNFVSQITSVDQVLKLWPFFNLGLEELRKPSKARETTTTREFLASLMRIVTGDPSSGIIMVLNSKNAKPIGFVVGSRGADHTSMQIVAAYVSDKCPDAIEDLRNALELWCKERGYTELRAYTRRINGSAMRWYENRLGFKREFVGFVKQL